MVVSSALYRCSQELAKAKQAYPRTCALCGLGPCQQEPPVRFKDAAGLAVQIAANVWPHIQDRQRRDELTVLLVAFAAEIKRSGIEP